MTTEPSAIAYDFSKSVLALGRKQSYHSANTFTLGLTSTEMQSDAKWSWSSLVDASGLACIRPTVAVFLTVNPQTVFVGHEFPQGGCAFNEIAKHELRHVHANQDHLEAVADYYQKAISEAFGQQIFYGSSEGLKRDMQASFTGYWLPLIKADLAKVSYLHSQIDTVH